MRSSTIGGLTDSQKNIIARTAGLSNQRQIKFLDFVSNMTSWEFEVFDAFRARLRVDELKDGTLAKEALEVFYNNPCDEVARLLVSVDLVSWRPTGVTIFAELVNIHQLRNDDVILKAIEKASSIGTKLFREEYPKYADTKSIPPKLILETVLKDDFNITLKVEKPDTTKVYDGLREEDEATI